MCGICGYISNNTAYDKLINGLKMLQNRGYDSAGVCTINCTINKDHELLMKKFASTDNQTAVERLSSPEYKEFFGDNSIGIAHTRWATHGAKTDVNSHPHISFNKKFALVHNGIIENYNSIKNRLIKVGVPFVSETDTEVIVNLIGYIYDQIYDQVGAVEKAVHQALMQLNGTWGLVIMCTDEPTRMYCARHGSPLLIGFNENNTVAMVSSEQAGFCKYVNNYIRLEDNDVVVLEKTDTCVEFYRDNDYEFLQVNTDNNVLTPDPYPHWTLKEIYEQPESSIRALGMGGRIKDDYEVKLGGLAQNIDDLKDVENLILLGCGTSYYAGLHCMHTFKTMCSFNTVQLFDGAEFTEEDVPKQGKTAVIILSQSGETKDLHRGLKLATSKDIITIGVVNVVDSMIAKEVTCGVYLNAGREVGVASTKAFTSQVVVLSLIAVFFAQIKGINKQKRKMLISGVRRLPINIEEALSKIRPVCVKIAEHVKPFNSVFVLGKGPNEAVAKEGSLKIKEISYIHAEGYSSSALKHGPFSLIEQGTPVIVVCPKDEHFTRNTSVIEEIKSRGAYVIAISDTDLTKYKADVTVTVPKNEQFSGILTVLALQLIAYELACVKGCSVDFPRNLCKTCNVD